MMKKIKNPIITAIIEGTNIFTNNGQDKVQFLINSNNLRKNIKPIIKTIKKRRKEEMLPFLVLCLIKSQKKKEPQQWNMKYIQQHKIQCPKFYHQ